MAYIPLCKPIVIRFLNLQGHNNPAVTFSNGCMPKDIYPVPVLTPAAVPGLIIGCFLSNLWSPLGVVDLLFGTLATGLSAIWSRSLRRYRLKGLPVLSALPPVVCNAVIVGLEIACLSDAGFSLQSFSWVAFFSSAASVGLGELVICLVLGVPLVTVLERSGAAKRIFEG